MPHSDRDPASVHDMLDASRSIVDMTVGVTFDQFVVDRKLYRAIEREIEIIGEAARRMSDTLKSAHPEVPWPQIIGTRHRLAHEYDEIRLAVIYRIATVHIAELIPQLQLILDTFPPPPPTAA